MTARLGIILPSKRLERNWDTHAAKLYKQFKPIRDNLAVLAVRITTDGFETKYWLDATHYAVVNNHTGKVNRFERRADGDYPVS